MSNDWKLAVSTQAQQVVTFLLNPSRPSDLRFTRATIWRRTVNGWFGGPEIRNGRATKVPYSPVTGDRASVTDPSDWATYEEARRFQLDRGFLAAQRVEARRQP